MSKDNTINSLNLEEALKKVLELSQTAAKKFVESVDIAVNLGIDAKQ